VDVFHCDPAKSDAVPVAVMWAPISVVLPTWPKLMAASKSPTTRSARLLVFVVATADGVAFPVQSTTYCGFAP
jgi:hypothetical protein